MVDVLKTVICALNSKYVHSSLAPWYLAAAVDRHCAGKVQAEVVEGTINEQVEAVAERIRAQKPDVVGVSCYIWNIAATLELVRLIKAWMPPVTVVLGGPEVSFNAAEILKAEPLVDYIIAGEGEKPFALFLNALVQAKSLDKIPGLCYRKGNEIVTSAPYLTTEEPPDPYTEKYLAALAGRMAYLETSRGCPFKCAFCLSGNYGKVRFFALEEAEKRMLLLANSGTQTIKLVDRTFNANRKRAARLFRFIIENYGTKIPPGVCFHFEMGGDLLDEETIELLATAPPGAIQFEIGIQSFNPQTLAAIKRKTDLERLKNNIQRILAPQNIHVHLDLIAGLPHEDLQSFQESFNTAYLLQPHTLQLGFLKVLWGTPMRDDPQKYPALYKKEPPYEVIATPWLSAEEINLLHQVEDAVNRLYNNNSGRFRRTLQYVLKQTGAAPFALFRGIGEFCAQHNLKHIALDDYTTLVFTYFKGQPGVEEKVLRDIMVCDRLATNASGRLPKVLQVYDPALKKLSKKMTALVPPPPGIRRGYALLYSENCLVYADYKEKNPVTGEYKLFKRKLPLKGK